MLSLASQNSLNLCCSIVPSSCSTRALTMCGGSSGSGTNTVIYPEYRSLSSIVRFRAKSQRTGIIIIFLIRSSIAIILFKSIFRFVRSFFYLFHSVSAFQFGTPTMARLRKMFKCLVTVFFHNFSI